MITTELLNKANEQLKTVDIKGKKYAQVHERVKAFREVCPGGQIITEIIDKENGVVTMRATINDEDGRTLATGLAQEKETNVGINKTSFIENCETSAVGRALGFAGIGIDVSMASAEEVAIAIVNQNKINKREQEALKALVIRKGLEPEKTFPGGLDLTAEQYVKALEKLNKLPDTNWKETPKE